MGRRNNRNRRARGTGSVYRRSRSRYWYIRYRDASGRRLTESSRSETRADAERILRERLQLIDSGESMSPQKVMFEDMLQLMLDDREVRGCRSKPLTKRLTEAFRGKRATAINGSLILAFETKRLKKDGAARATVNQELATLRRMFNLAVEHGILRPTDMPRIRTPNPRNARQGFFEEADLKMMLEHLPTYLRPVILLGYYTGWRVRSEVLPMKWSQVDFDAGIVRLEPNTTKNDEGREFPFSSFPHLRGLLESQRERTRALEKETGRIIPWVFHRSGRRIKSYRSQWDMAREAASTEERDGVKVVTRPHLKDRLVHDLRRTAVRNLERAGVPRSVAMKLTGHKTEAVYRRYAIVAKSDLEEGVAKLAKLHQAGG